MLISGDGARPYRSLLPVSYRDIVPARKRERERYLERRRPI
jgi:hypothetical protein